MLDLNQGIAAMVGRVDDPASYCLWALDRKSGPFAEAATDETIAADTVAFREATRWDLQHDAFALLEDGMDPMVIPTIPVILIDEGPGNRRHNHWYGPEAIQSIIELVAREGTKCYLDHPSESERKERPERSVRDLSGFYINPRGVMVRNREGLEVLAAAADLVPADTTAGFEVRALARHAQLHRKLFPMSEVPFCGISIHGDGKQSERKVNEQTKMYVDQVTRLDSADTVTLPARGGTFVQEFSRIMRASSPKEAESMLSAAQIGEFKGTTALLEAAVTAGDAAKVKQIVADHRTKVLALAEAEGVPALKLADNPFAKDKDKEKDKEKEKDMESLRESLGKVTAIAESSQATIRTLETRLAESEGKSTKQADLAECERLLVEANVPDALMTPIQLSEIPTASRPEWVKRMKGLAESQGLRRSVPGTVARSAPAASDSGLTESVRDVLNRSGVPLVAAGA